MVATPSWTRAPLSKETFLRAHGSVPDGEIRILLISRGIVSKRGPPPRADPTRVIWQEKERRSLNEGLQNTSALVVEISLADSRL
jgi:hypothetical protein